MFSVHNCEHFYIDNRTTLRDNIIELMERKVVMRNFRFLFLGVLLLTACGKEVALKISSASFATTGATALLGFLATPSAPVTEFKFCVKRVKLQGEDDSPIRKEGEKGENGEDHPDDIRFAPGLIDISDGKAHDWGTMEIPTGFKLKRIQIKVRKDQELCGVNYSVKFNDAIAVENFEIKWRFNPPIDLASNIDVLELSFNNLVASLRQAADEERLNNQLKERIEEIEEQASGR